MLKSLCAALEKHPQYEEHVRDAINPTAAVAERQAHPAYSAAAERIPEEVRKALDDKQAEIKVEEKSAQSVQQTIKDLFGSIGK